MPYNYKTTDFTGQTFCIGLDVHKKSWTVTVRTSLLEVAHFTQEPNAQQLVHYLKNRFPNAEFYSAYEAGFCGTAAHHALCKAGIHNIIIHPADLPKTDKQRKNKTDHHDSRAAARYLEAGLLKSIYIMPDDQQQRRALYRLQQSKVRDVTRCSNRLRSFLDFFSVELPPQFENKKYISNRFLIWLKSVKLQTEHGGDVLHQYIEELIYQRKELLQITKKLKQAMLDHYAEQYKSLLTIPGIGPITAMALLSETGDLSRFDDPDEFASYLGLMPAEHSSGETVSPSHLQPRCNTHLRPILIEAAWMAIRNCPVLLSYYKKHVRQNEKKAIVKVARKLALIAKSVALNHSSYQPSAKVVSSIQGKRIK
jgi:transposase